MAASESIKAKDIWVLAELPCATDEPGKLALGLLTEARRLAEKIGGQTTALLFGEQLCSQKGLLGKYGIDRALVFLHPDLQLPNSWRYAEALEGYDGQRPAIFLTADTALGMELAPHLAVKWKTALVAGCVRIDPSGPSETVFYRSDLGGQAYREMKVEGDSPWIAILDAEVLNNLPALSPTVPEVITLRPELKAASRVSHVRFMPADRELVDISEAPVVVGAGVGALPAEIFPLVKELAGLIGGALGGTRPAVDEGEIERERLIGQTGKAISPDLYLALGLSGASHHVGGIQEAKTIVSLNRDPAAPIFNYSDEGLVGDLKDVLPVLIRKIREARQNGRII